MRTGTLTPRSNNFVKGIRFTGQFGQPDGFGSVLDIEIKMDGRAVFTLQYKPHNGEEHVWSVELDNEQRKVAADLLGSYEPTLFESIK